MTDARITNGASARDEDRMFDGALNSVLQIDKRDYPCYVGGLKVASGHERIVTSPVDTSIQFGRFQEPEGDLPDIAAEAAANAFRTWSKKGPAERAEIFVNVLNTVRKQKYRIAAAVTVSCGMIREDSVREVERLAEIMEDGCDKIKKGIKGRPTGVWAVMAEYNSPLAAPMGYAISAMLAGNTVVLIPPKECPFPVYMLYDILVAAALPDGVLNIIFDPAGKAAAMLVENENVAGIAAAGRSDRFEDLMFAAADGSEFISEFKGMNPFIIYRPSSMQAAAGIAVRSAFRYSGQRTDSCSKVIITADEQKQFIDHLLTAAKNITVGDPAEKGTFVGPVISKESMDTFLNIVKGAKDALIFGGKRAACEVADFGHYAVPAIFMGLPSDHDLNTMDHSLPILSVQVASNIEEAMELAGDCETGICSGIISKDGKAVERFLAEAASEKVYVNSANDASGVALYADVNRFVK